jgi:dinuclear metal center YbgI/SA1388 family protein
VTTVADVERALSAIAPFDRALRGDNVGLLIGEANAAVSSVLLAIDLSTEVVAEAVETGCSLVVAYHPPLYGEVRTLRAGDPAHEAIRAGLSVLSPHTALDVADGGTSDVLAAALGVEKRAPVGEVARLGRVPRMSRLDFVEKVKRVLGVSHVLVGGPLEGTVTRVAVAPGAARADLFVAIAAGAEVFVTGEVRHHDALAAARAGLTVICSLHSNSERLVLRPLGAALGKKVRGVKFLVSERDRDPFVVR